MSSFIGRKFDNAGELIGNATGWSKLSIKHFKEKAECLVKQFGHYKVLNKFHVRNVYWSVIIINTRKYMHAETLALL